MGLASQRWPAHRSRTRNNDERARKNLYVIVVTGSSDVPSAPIRRRGNGMSESPRRHRAGEVRAETNAGSGPAAKRDRLGAANHREQAVLSFLRANARSACVTRCQAERAGGLLKNTGGSLQCRGYRSVCGASWEKPAEAVASRRPARDRHRVGHACASITNAWTPHRILRGAGPPAERARANDRLALVIQHDHVLGHRFLPK